MKKKDIEEKLKYYMSLNYPMVITREEGVYFVQFPDLQGCMIHGKTPASALRIAEEVKADWIREILKLELPVPEPRKDEDYSGKFIVRIPPALHRRLSEQAASEGRSLNSHAATLMSERSASLTVEKAVAGAVNNIEIAMGKAMSKIEDTVNAAVGKLERTTARATSNAHYAIAGHFSAADAVPAKFYGQYVKDKTN